MIAIDVQGLTSADKYALLECLQSRGWNSCDLSRYFAHPFWLINQYQVIFSMDTTPYGASARIYKPEDLTDSFIDSQADLPF